jgi:CheY-like chemotaxis protein
MRLEELSGSLLAKAVNVFLKLAYPRAHRQRYRKAVSWDASLHGTGLLATMRDESLRYGTGRHRYTLRLGNERYPFMKLCLEEWVEPGEYFLFVDTHDELEISPGDPDYEAWNALRSFNLQLKDAIEAAWHRGRLPTLKQAQRMLPRRPGTRVAVVGENARYEGELVSAFLKEDGFRTTVTDDPERLRRLVQKRRPQLAVVNSFVGEIPGRILAQNLKEDYGKKLRVVMLLARSDQHPQEVEADYVLNKPVTRSEMKKALSAVFGSNNGGKRKTD